MSAPCRYARLWHVAMPHRDGFALGRGVLIDRMGVCFVRDLLAFAVMVSIYLVSLKEEQKYFKGEFLCFGL